MPNDAFSSADPFYNLDGNDGFHVLVDERGPVLTLTLATYSGGESVTETEVFDYFDPTPAQRAECTRLRLVLDAVCRYFTTGGSWRCLDMALKVAERAIPGGLSFPGYHLLTSYSTTDGDYQHVFVRDGTNKAVLWNEPEVGDSGKPVGGWIDATTLEKIREDQEDDESGWQQGRRVKTRQAEETGQSGPPQLPPRQGAGAAEDPESGPGCRVPEHDAHW